MKSIEIIGFKRANLGKRESKNLRIDSNVPCVLYGGKDQVHFYAPMFLFRDLVYTPSAHKVELSVDNTKYTCILQDIQFHPVNEMILHADFLELNEDKEVKMDIPVKFVGTAPGVQKGGKLVQKIKKIKIKSLPKNLPDFIEVDIANLDLNKSAKIGDLTAENFTILNNKSLPIVTIEVPRALKGQAEGEGGDEKKKK
ncbi:MAG TPA: 50S ribosomal protein L25/general stress protein Ctc [Cytophagaceae bacterium]